MSTANLEELLLNRPKTKRGEATLERICNAAEQIFIEKGYHAASIHDITSLAGIGAGTFYIYFEGKKNLYRYLILQYGHKVRRHLSQAVSNAKTRQEAEREGLRAWLEFVIQNKYVFNITWESLYIDKKIFDEYYKTFAEAYIERLKTAQNQGEVRPIDPEVLSYILMGIAHFVGLNWVIFKEETELDDIVDEAMKFINQGMFFPEKSGKAMKKAMKNE